MSDTSSSGAVDRTFYPGASKPTLPRAPHTDFEPVPVPASAVDSSSGGPSEAVLQVVGLRKSYASVEALCGVDLDVHAGEIVSLLGPNGAGKSTFVSILSGLRRATSGSIAIGGVDAVAHPHQVRGMVGVAPQDLALYPVVSVLENLRLFGEVYGIRGRALRARIGEVASALRIEPLLDRPAGDLSGGQKRRVHTAMALLHRPRLLILDEATAGADVETRTYLIDLVRELADDGAAVVYSTHYLQEVEMLGATVALLEAGRIITRGSVPDLVSRHASPAVEFRFAGEAPLDTHGIPEESVERCGELLRITTPNPARTIAEVIAACGAESDRLRGVEIVQPTMEAVYLALTGRRYASSRSS